MDSFLGKISAALHHDYPTDMGKVALVFPNRRAGLYLRKHLAQQLQGPAWSPETFSIEDFVFEVLGVQKADHEFLLFEFYQIHTLLKKDKAQSFQDFSDWADTALRDFNDIDLSMANGTALYQYIDEAKALQIWNPGQDHLTAFESSYLDFFRSFGKYYESLTESQLLQHKLSQGLAYRRAAENIEEILQGLRWDKVWFVGFNALNPAEKKILEAFTRAGKARLFFDIDKYYFEDDSQEAGIYLRKYFETHDKEKIEWVTDKLLTESKEIHIIGVPQLISQAKAAGQILSSLPPDTMDKTAVVLGDENLLIPVIHALPENLGDFNVTMGMPLQMSAYHGLFENLFQLYRTALIFSAKPRENADFHVSSLRFYHQDLVKLFQHPGIFSVVPGIRLASKKIQLSNRSFYSGRDIKEILFEGAEAAYTVLGPLFERNPYAPFTLLEGGLALIGLMKGKETAANDLDIEYLYHFSILFNRLLELKRKYNPDIDLGGLRALYRQAVRGTKLPFYGEPLKGAQLMGMLETRNLDFDQVILLNVNEDIMPSGKTYNSFIPFDIRKEHGLPTYRDNQAVFAYHFYHLLQHAKKIFLLYNVEPGPVGGGDKSRFISQLLQEMPVKNPKVSIIESVLHLLPSSEPQEREIRITKDEDILNRINTLLTEKGLSASRLNSYLSCSLRFYFESIEKLRESEEVEETMEAGTFGNAIHKAVHTLFLPYLGLALKAESYKAMQENLEDAAMDGFRDALPEGDLQHGKNHLFVQAGISLIRKLLKNEADSLGGPEKSVARIVHALEKRYTFERNGILYQGIIDRIDKAGDHYEVLDYKTGSVMESQLKFTSIEALREKKGSEKLIQLLFYTQLLIHDPEFMGFPIKTGIISMRKLNTGTIFTNLPVNENELEVISQNFLEFLDEISNEIKNPALQFTQTNNADNCSYCAFKTICNR